MLSVEYSSSQGTELASSRSLIVRFGIQGRLGDWLKRVSAELEPSQSHLQRGEIHLLLFLARLLIFFCLLTVEEDLFVDITAEEVGQNRLRGQFVQGVYLFGEHDDLFEGVFIDGGGDFGPNGIEQHGSVDEDQSVCLAGYLCSIRGKNFSAFAMMTASASSIFFEASCIILPSRSITQITCSDTPNISSASSINRW